VAIEDQHNLLHQLKCHQRRHEFLLYLLEHKTKIEALVAYHLRLSCAHKCRVSTTEEWIHGSFNLCVPVGIHDLTGATCRRVIVRFPLPYKIGESTYPGNTEEKLRCEAATYAWIQTNCPDISTPRLWGFGFCNGYRVSNDEQNQLRSC
jgi:hypothetical protein